MDGSPRVGRELQTRYEKYRRLGKPEERENNMMKEERKSKRLYKETGSVRTGSHGKCQLEKRKTRKADDGLLLYSLADN